LASILRVMGSASSSVFYPGALPICSTDWPRISAPWATTAAPVKALDAFLAELNGLGEQASR
jgi:hypothetical protein